MTDTVEPVKRDVKALKGASKVARIPIKIVPSDPKRKPEWIRAKSQGAPFVKRIKQMLRDHDLHTVCEEASCPNLGECFAHGTATFLIMGNICTRRCPFCDVAHGRPDALDENEPNHLAKTIAAMQLKHVVVTSVDRDDLRDGGAAHFSRCISEIRLQSPQTRIEVLVPDFRGRMDVALEILADNPPDIFNHNLESIPRLYKAVRPGSDYQWSLDLIQRFQREVNSSVVLINASSRFSDGNQLGLGAEIGISTSRMHAYGPMGLRELTTTKFVVQGEGQIRE